MEVLPFLHTNDSLSLIRNLVDNRCFHLTSNRCLLLMVRYTIIRRFADVMLDNMTFRHGLTARLFFLFIENGARSSPPQNRC